MRSRYYRCGRTGPTLPPAPGAATPGPAVLSPGVRERTLAAHAHAHARRGRAVLAGLLLCLVSAAVSAGLIVLLGWLIGHAL